MTVRLLNQSLRLPLFATSIFGLATLGIIVQVAAQTPPAPAVIETTPQKTTLGLEGYCPVCVINMKQWVKGDPSIQATHDGKTYYFPGEEQKKIFLANPAKYAPALGGDCSVCLTEMGKRETGSVRFSAIMDDRLFLFPNSDIKSKFLANPTKYSQADLAMNGNCAVCRVEMKTDMKGKAEFATTYQGLRYLFPSNKERSMFLANPMKYAVKDLSGRDLQGGVSE